MASRPLLARIEGLPIIGVLLVLVAVFMIAAPQVFLGYRIYMSFLATVPPQLILALGLTLVIASGEIDLSFPSVIAFSGFLFAWAFKTYELTWLALLLALAGGALIGWVNGILVAVIGIPSIIATLATQFFWGGITTVMTGGLSYAIRTIDEYAIHAVLVGRIGVVPVQALWVTAVAVALWFVLNRHRFGEHLLFIGDNVEVARVVGVKTASRRATPGRRGARSFGDSSGALTPALAGPVWLCSWQSAPSRTPPRRAPKGSGAAERWWRSPRWHSPARSGPADRRVPRQSPLIGLAWFGLGFWLPP